MAKRTVTHYEDDLVGGEASESVAFGLDGSSYHIDLNEKNAAKLRKALSAYISAGRPAVHVSTPRGPRGTSAAKNDVGAIRAWAVEQGYEVGHRGRIPASVAAAYQAR